MISTKKMSNGFEYIEIHNASACANISLQGAQIFHYEREDEKPILWLSDISDFENAKAIRGGIPICWPWFGAHKTDATLPQHGFARTSMFELIQTEEIDTHTTEVILKLEDTKESLAMWPYTFVVLVKITVSDKLSIEITTTNLDHKPFEITQALHTYFDVSHISNVKVEGLDNKHYFDALTKKKCVQSGSITFSEEVDRVYQDVKGKIFLVDKERNITVENEGSSSVVVWNPWIEKCVRMSAMNDNAYESMLCIESANAFDDYKVIQANASHTLKATIY